MAKFLLWNPEKVSKYLNIPEAEQNVTYILTTEAKTGLAASSYISCSSQTEALKIADAILNECDIQVYVGKIPDRIEVVLYRGADYSGFTDALEDGALYHTKIFLTLHELLHDKFLVDRINQAIGLTSKCINDDQSDIQVVLVDSDHPNKVFDWLMHYLPESVTV